MPPIGDNVLFVLMGNQKYYPLLRINIECIRQVYPCAAIVVYDWGDGHYRPAFAAETDSVTVIDWGGAIKDVAALETSLDPASQIDIAIRYNARFRRTFAQRVKKKILKTVPGSFLARPLLRAGLIFENMLTQKIPCMRHASALAAGRKMVFLDADAFLLQSVDDILGRDDMDIGLTLIEKQCFDLNQCSVINSGVIFFGPRQDRRDAFLAEWAAACAACTEWLKEQTSLVRMLSAKGAAALFDPYGQATMDFAGLPVSLLSLPRHPFNNTDHGCLAAADLPRIVHLANTAHNDRYFDDLSRQLQQARQRVG